MARRHLNGARRPRATPSAATCAAARGGGEILLLLGQLPFRVVEGESSTTVGIIIFEQETLLYRRAARDLARE